MIGWLLRATLCKVVAKDYRMRAVGQRPDRWHWADLMLLRLGYSTDENAMLYRFRHSKP